MRSCVLSVPCDPSACSKEVESNVLFPMSHPELYAAVAQHTRVKPEPNQFGAYVFTGPPGTGELPLLMID